MMVDSQSSMMSLLRVRVFARRTTTVVSRLFGSQQFGSQQLRQSTIRFYATGK